MFFSPINLTFVLCCHGKAENLNKKLSKNPNYQICGKVWICSLSESVRTESRYSFCFFVHLFFSTEKEKRCVLLALWFRTQTTQQRKPHNRTEKASERKIATSQTTIASSQESFGAPPPSFRASYTSPDSFRTSTKPKITILKFETLYETCSIRNLS